MENKKGFTLVEILAVVVILGIILLIAVPSVNKVINDTSKSTFISEVKMFYNAVSNADVLESDNNNNEFYFSDLVNDSNYKGVAKIKDNSIYITLCSEKYCVIGAGKEVSENNIFEDIGLFNEDEKKMSEKAIEVLKKLFAEKTSVYNDDNLGDEGDFGNTTSDGKFIITYENLSKAGYIPYSNLYEGYMIIDTTNNDNKIDFVEKGTDITYPASTHREYSKSEFLSLISEIAKSSTEVCFSKEEETEAYNYFITITNDLESNKKLVRAVYERKITDSNPNPWYYLVGVTVVTDSETNKKIISPDTIDNNTETYDSFSSKLTFRGIDYKPNNKIDDISSKIKCSTNQN